MPLYEYRCQECGHEHEQLVMSGKAAPCPACGSDELEKKFSVFSRSGASPEMEPLIKTSPKPSGGHSHVAGSSCGRINVGRLVKRAQKKGVL